MTNQSPESVIAEAMSSAGAPLMHSRVEEGVASALRAANMLREHGVPDAATAAIERVTAERDAAMARIAKAWELHEPFTWSFGYGPVQSCKWCADHGVSQEVASWPCPTVAALEGAPELAGLPVEGESKP